MKKIVLLMAAIVSLSACQKVKNLANITFNIPYSQTETIPAAPGYNYGTPIPGTVDVPFPAVTVATNASQYFNQYHASQNNVVSAYVGNMTLQITAPANQNFDFLSSIQLFISAPSQPEVLVAYLDSIPKGLTTIDMSITPGLDLKNYIVGDSITIRLDAKVDAVPAPGTQIQSSGNFKVTANPLD